MACSKFSRQNEDFISNVPDVVIDKILECLPIHTIAQTSVLSKQWRHTWLSLKSLIFDDAFWNELKTKNGRSNWRQCSRIISSILLHHNGPVHEFYLYIPYDADVDRMNHSQWLSFLSKNGVRKIVIRNWSDGLDITSYIFWCSELVHLELHDFILNPPPTGFRGFPNLKHLELLDVEFTQQNTFCKLIANCRTLATLRLESWFGMDQIVIDAPSLKTLILKGCFESLAFRNFCSLESLSMGLLTMPETIMIVETIDAINLLASSSRLQSIEFEGYLCKFLAAGGVARSPPVTFNHLDTLRLNNIDLGDFGVFRYVLGMVETYPNIKKLDISVYSRKNADDQKFDYNFSHKLDHLLEVTIEGITGSRAELKLIEYLLAISVVLENLFFKSRKLEIESERKMSRALMAFPRASPKARLVCLE